ncbi:MAG TPA: hypothetical protein VF271_07060 [Rhodanobacteraceae bacterium]
MKASLLFTGLILGTACFGTAQATELDINPTLPTLHSQASIAMAAPGGGVLSDISHLLSDTTQAGQSSQTGNTHGVATHDATTPSSRSTTGHHATRPRHANTSGLGNGMNADLPPESSNDDNAASASSTGHQILGWQSLLPGSIQ